jgi:hypothetical protein
MGYQESLRVLSKKGQKIECWKRDWFVFLLYRVGIMLGHKGR